MFGIRPYHRAAGALQPRSMTVSLLIANTVLFLVSCLAYGFPPTFPPDGWWALNLADGFKQLAAWQFLTFQLLHAGPLHLLINSWVIYRFGKDVERSVGRASLLLLYVGCGLVGSLVQLAAAVLAPEVFGHTVVGASACAAGLLAVYATLYPDRQFSTLILFIIPASIRGRNLLLLTAGLASLAIALPADQVAYAANLGGLFAGWLIVKLAERRFGRGWHGQPAPSTIPAAQATVTFVTAKPPLKTETPIPASVPAEMDTTEFLRRRVDPILEKIHAHGLNSLTHQEREILERASQRIGDE